MAGAVGAQVVYDVRRCFQQRLGGLLLAVENAQRISCADACGPPRQLAIQRGEVVHQLLHVGRLAGRTAGRVDVQAQAGEAQVAEQRQATFDDLYVHRRILLLPMTSIRTASACR